VSGRGEETALSRTRKLTGEVILGRYCPLETARRPNNYWQVFFDTNKLIAATFGSAGYPPPYVVQEYRARPGGN